MEHGCPKLHTAFTSRPTRDEIVLTCKETQFHTSYRGRGGYQGKHGSGRQMGEAGYYSQDHARDGIHHILYHKEAVPAQLWLSGAPFMHFLISIKATGNDNLYQSLEITASREEWRQLCLGETWDPALCRCCCLCFHLLHH